jgi:hypothetical protein
MTLGSRMSFSSDAKLARLAHFAGRHLAIASRIILDDGFLLPFGFKLTLSLWSGATEEIVGLQTDDPKLNLQMAESWFMEDHKKAEFVSVALDSFVTIDGARTDAVAMSVRPKDFSYRILVFLPYTPKTENSPTALRAPQVDFPAPSASLLPKQDFVLANLLRGRDSLYPSLRAKRSNP